MLKSAIRSTIELDMSWLLGADGGEKEVLELVEIFPVGDTQTQKSQSQWIICTNHSHVFVWHLKRTPERYLSSDTSSSWPWGRVATSHLGLNPAP